MPQRISAPVDAGPRSGPRWGLPSGLLRRQIGDRLFALRSEIGSKLANRTTRYIVATSYGPPNGHLSKSRPAAGAKKRVDVPTMMPLIVNGEGQCEGSGAG